MNAILVLMDPIDSIDIFHDTSFSILREAQRRSIKIYYGLTHDLFVQNGEAFLKNAREIEVQDIQGEHYRVLSEQTHSLSQFNAVFMRKDPPFNLDYIYSTYLLDLACTQTRVINHPSALRNWNEKTSILQFPDLTPATLVAQSSQVIRKFVSDRGGKAIIKPLDGFGGRGIFIADENDPNFNVILETATQHFSCFVMMQEYIPQIKTHGDKRIILIDGEPIGAMVRLPQGIDHRGNMVAGAITQSTELTPRDQEIIQRLQPSLKKEGVFFAGIDVIGDFLTEINVTSPTGFQEIDRLNGISCASLLFDALEASLKKNP